MLNKKYILKVGITDEKAKTILESVFELLKKDKKFFIVTPNPEIVVYATKHPSYEKVLNRAEIALADGIGLFVAGKILGKSLAERFTGVDFIENLCMKSKDQPISIGFLGGRSGIAEKAAECLQAKYPWIEVVFASDEWSEPGFTGSVEARSTHQEARAHSIEEEGRGGKKPTSPVHHVEPNHAPTIDLLFVAFGAPKQEEWIAENLEKLPIKAAMGVGGSLDYISEEVKRAPAWIRSMGLEWLFRLVLEPWRWKRQMALLEFLWLVLKASFGKPQNDHV